MTSLGSAAAPRVRVVVSYFADPSPYPRAGDVSDRGWMYWANIAVCAATLRHVSPSAEVLVYAGDDPPTDVAGLLRRSGVEIRHQPFDHRPPSDFFDRYLGSLYLLDVLGALESDTRSDDVLIFADPDIVWAAPIQPLVEEVRKGGIVGYDLAVPDFVPLCDITRRQQGDLLAELTGHGPDPEEDAPTHFGGELYGMLGRELPDLVKQVAAIWEANYSRYEAGLSHFHVEEHILNAVLWQRGEQTGRANPFIQRVLTVPAPFGTRGRVHPGLVAWHLPMEKNDGLRRLYDILDRGRPMPAPGRRYQRWLGHRVGTRPIGLRWLADRARQVLWIFNGALRNRGPQYGL